MTVNASMSAHAAQSLRPEQFPLLVSAVTDAQQARLARAIADIANGIEAGSIPNPSYVEAKERINRAIEAAWDKHVSAHCAGRYAELTKVEEEIVFSSHSCARDVTVLARRLSRIEENTTFLQAARQFVQEALPLATAVSDLKTKAVKRQARTEEEREAQARYQPPPGSEASAKLIVDVLEAITERHRQALFDALVRAYEGDLGAFVRREAQRDLRTTRLPPLLYPVNRLVETRQEGPRWRYAPVANASERVSKLASADAQAIRDAFVHKNLRKLHAIVEAKGNLLSIDVVREYLRLRGLEGTLHVRFQDGAHFQARNSVVLSHSVHGTPFLRFPLTFHAVYLSDGSRMARPSEERMNTVFLAAGADEQAASPPTPRPRMRG